MSPEPRRRFPWLLTILSALALALLITLGVWQVQRLQWKQDLIARAEAAAQLPPAPLDAVAEGPEAEFRRVVVRCPGLAAAPWVELQSIQDGRPGVRLVSVCRPEGGAGALLVDRGFVADHVSARPTQTGSDATVEITGVLRRVPSPNRFAPPPRDGRFYARDQQAMAAALGESGDVGDRVLFAETSSNPEWPALHPSAPPAAFSNDHLGYALTWFGLAIALVVFYGALLRRRRR